MTADARALDWDEVTARLAAAAESPAGRALCLALPLADDVGEARRRMAAVAELARLLRAGETLPSLAAPEIRPRWRRPRRRSRSGRKSCARSRRLRTSREAMRRYLLAPTPVRDPRDGGPGARSRPSARAGARRRRDLRRVAGRFVTRRRRSSSAARRAPGPCRSRARRHRGAHARRGVRVRHAGSVLHDPRGALRAAPEGEREVARSGIVHDTSRTGETVFVEPTALVAVNNRLKVTELEIRA